MIAGNWKMNKTVPQALEFVRALRSEIAEVAGVEVVLCPPATALYAVREELAGTDTEIALGAQDCFWKNSGGLHRPGQPDHAGGHRRGIRDRRPTPSRADASARPSRTPKATSSATSANPTTPST